MTQTELNSIAGAVGNGVNAANIVIQAAAITSFAKTVVDVLKKSPIFTPSWSLPVFAWMVGIMFAFGMLFASGGTLSLQTASMSFMVGFLGGTGAIAVTELQRSSESK